MVTLAVLILFIAYRKLLAYLGKGAPPKEDYCVLYSLEENPAKGEVEIYFTSEKKRKVTIFLMNQDLEEIQELSNKECYVGGNIIRFDSSAISNGIYFFGLRTENQKTMKKMEISNPWNCQDDRNIFSAKFLTTALMN